MSCFRHDIGNRGLSFLIAILFLALSWLLPNASPPWNAFHKDLLSATVMLTFSASLVLKQRLDKQHFRIDAVSITLLVFALGALGQWAVGEVHFSGVAFIGFAYFGAAAILVVMGRYWEGSSAGAVGDFVFSAVVVAALVTSGLMFKQWLGVEGLDAWIQYLPAGGRPYGNLMQPNNAATLLLLGLIGLVWANNRGFLNKVTVATAGLPLLAALVLAQSRIAFISLTVLIIAGLIRAWYSKQNINWKPILWTWAAGFVLLVWLMPSAFQWLELPMEPSLIERSRSEVRGMVYATYWEALLNAPLLGYGFGQTVLAQIAAAEIGYELPGLFIWTHNLFLDIGIWFGLPAMLVLLIVGLWAVAKIIKINYERDELLYVASLFVFLMHAMVELPHTYAYFLLPCSLILGALCQYASIPSWKISKRIIGSALIVAGALLATIAFDYIRVENAFYAWRFKQANIGVDHPMNVPKALLLNQFEALLKGVRASPGELNEKQLENLEHAAILEPSPAAIQSTVIMLVNIGQASRAQALIDRSRFLFSHGDRDTLAASWNFLRQQDNTYSVVSWPNTSLSQQKLGSDVNRSR